MSQNSAGSSQLGKRQVRSRRRMNSSSAVEGRYWGSAASGGRRRRRTLAPSRINSASSGVGTAPPPMRAAAPGAGVVESSAAEDSPDIRGSGCAVSASASARTWITTLPARPSGVGDGHSSLSHRQARCWAPAARAPSASARRWPTVRGSSSHRAWAIWLRRRSKSEASLASSRPHSDAVPLSGLAAPIDTSRPRALYRVRRRAPGSILSTQTSIACSSLYCDSASQRSACPARASSIAASASGSKTNAVRHTSAATTRAPSAPRRNNSATPGSRCRSASARCICPEAREWLIPSAADTSAAAESQSSQAQSARSPSAQRRRVSSATAASLWATAAASVAFHSPMAATRAASSTLSNNCSNIDLMMPGHTDRIATGPAGVAIQSR